MFHVFIYLFFIFVFIPVMAKLNVQHIIRHSINIIHNPTYYSVLLYILFVFTLLGNNS